MDFNLSCVLARTGTLLGETEIPSPDAMIDLFTCRGTGGARIVVWLGGASVRFCRLDTGINECVDALWRISELFCNFDWGTVRFVIYCPNLITFLVGGVLE